ncbi:MAG: dephospho-CoA kinase [Bacteroidetes bacterium]|nr:dephospho-CoA kinase [Bacteroidota bacterium]MBS1618478.1 dephospho-CoA kinase [Bacteroidota bacterium]
MLKVGITGGIGSGKTTVCQIFERLGVPVYYADQRAKELMEDDKQLVADIRKEFGDDVYDAEGKLQRKKLAEIVFNNEELLVKLNSLVHPAVFKDNQSWNEVLAKKGYPYTLKEAALLVETGSYLTLDKLIVVSAPEEDRIKRVMERDQATREQVVARIKAQMPEEQKVKYADYIIYNDTIMELVPQVTKIHLDLTNIN